MARKNKQEITLTPSGHEVDQDLAKVPIKVYPSLQALITNQIELIDMVEGKTSRDPIFIEQHKIEMLQVEEEIAGAFSDYMKKKEKAREKRRLQKTALEEEKTGVVNDEYEPVPAAERETLLFPGDKSGSEPLAGEQDTYVNRVKEQSDIPFDMTPEETGFDALPSGLPSSRYEKRTVTEDQKTEVDVRRVALGASIKALQTFLGRELTEAEMKSLEDQVDAYLG